MYFIAILKMSKFTYGEIRISSPQPLLKAPALISPSLDPQNLVNPLGLNRAFTVFPFRLTLCKNEGRLQSSALMDVNVNYYYLVNKTHTTFEPFN